MSNARGKAIDNTHLSIDTAEERGFIHRDYIAHCLRWTYVVKQMYKQGAYKTARILDIGCGKEMPLAKTLMSSRLAPELYLGVDYNKLELPEAFRNTKFKPLFMGNTDFARDYKVDGSLLVNNAPFTHVVCFEMLEHVEPEHAVRTLAAMKDAAPDAEFFISTPCYDPHTGAADNHVNEMSYEAFGAVLEGMGFQIIDHFGTFASQKDYKPHLDRAETEVFNNLSSYYDSNYLATIFAPLYPQYSRNVLWHCRVVEDNYTKRQFKHLIEVPKPWSSSERQQELLDALYIHGIDFPVE